MLFIERTNMHIAGGIVSHKPIGIVSNNPNFGQQQAAQQREAERQAQVDALAAKLAAQHQAQQAQAAEQQKKWSVPFN